MSGLDRFGFLKGTTVECAEFHRLRTMFCLKDGAVKVGPPGSALSHIEWFESEGWITAANVEEFLEGHVRGFYLPDKNELYCYKGSGFYFDGWVFAKLIENIGKLKEILGLDENTKLYLGSKDAIIGGIRYKQGFVGTLKDLVGSYHAQRNP
jgi:hypothetical protein